LIKTKLPAEKNNLLYNNRDSVKKHNYTKFLRTWLCTEIITALLKKYYQSLVLFVFFWILWMVMHYSEITKRHAPEITNILQTCRNSFGFKS